MFTDRQSLEESHIQGVLNGMPGVSLFFEFLLPGLAALMLKALLFLIRFKVSHRGQPPGAGAAGQRHGFEDHEEGQKTTHVAVKGGVSHGGLVPWGGLNKFKIFT